MRLIPCTQNHLPSRSSHGSTCDGLQRATAEETVKVLQRVMCQLSRHRGIHAYAHPAGDVLKLPLLACEQHASFALCFESHSPTT